MAGVEKGRWVYWSQLCRGSPGPSKSGNETLNQLQVSGAKRVLLASWLGGLTRSFANMLMRDQINLVELGFTSQGRSFRWVLWWRGIINKEPARSTNPAEKCSLSGLWGIGRVSVMIQTKSVHMELAVELRWASQEERSTRCHGGLVCKASSSVRVGEAPGAPRPLSIGSVFVLLSDDYLC